MKKKTCGQELWPIFLYSFLLFILLGSIFLLLSVWNEKNVLYSRRQDLADDEQMLVHTEGSTILYRISRLTSDLTYIQDTLNLIGLESQNYTVIEKQWISFVDHEKIYDHIRFIDTSGQEIIRVNYQDRGAYAVPEEELQNKADRSYFMTTIGLQKNQIFISRLSLNTEKESGSSSTKPIIRLSIPYYDENGTLRGIVCINYLAEDMLSRVRLVATGSSGSIYLLNAEGYWLYNGEDSSKEWAFLYGGRQGESFSNTYPEEWAQICAKNQGVINSKNGLFVYTNVLTSQEYVLKDLSYKLVLGEGDWRLVSHVRPDGEFAAALSWDLPSIIFYAMHKNVLIFLIIYALSLALGILLIYRRRKKIQLQYFADNDEMTGAMNRRAGIKRLEKMVQGNYSVCLCFLDINGLKDVNDLLGHQAGDELILTVVNTIKANIRGASDFLIRMGGDEFMLVFEGFPPERAERIWSRIRGNFDEINMSGERKYFVSVSHGIEAVHSGDSLEGAIRKADEKMYEEKRMIKQSGNFLRE